MTAPWQDAAMFSASLLVAAIMWVLIDALAAPSHPRLVTVAVLTACR